MNSREEIKRVLTAGGEPAPRGGDSKRAVWARIDACRAEVANRPRWSWLPRRWELAGVFAGAVAVGVISAEWRLRRDEAAASAEHRRYLASIDPTIAVFPAGRP